MKHRLHVFVAGQGRHEGLERGVQPGEKLRQAQLLYAQQGRFGVEQGQTDGVAGVVGRDDFANMFLKGRVFGPGPLPAPTPALSLISAPSHVPRPTSHVPCPMSHAPCLVSPLQSRSSVGASKAARRLKLLDIRNLEGMADARTTVRAG